MKKILFILMMLLSFTVASAQIQNYRTTAFAYATVNNGNYNWSDWEKSNIIITIDLNRDVITIYSPSKQVYYVYNVANNGNSYTDSSGGKNVKFYIIDQDGDKGEIRLRIETNGNSQLYVDFNNCAWVYNLIRVS